ncbi:MAG: prepilin-type N-terminal cleavage/methylation domain-containing protein [Candidatus Omnitrophica bacterium]|nr:prepilin-type N-terminal cleavage/methylation domain-containing protein [Candidatus Omnitrophota bacterium]
MKQNGFTLIELVLVIAIVALLAAAITPVINSARQRAIAARILQDYETIKTACVNFNSDTGVYAQQTYDCVAEPNFCHLLNDTGIPGWKGPYLAGEFSNDFFPDIDKVVILPWLSRDWDLDGDGITDKSMWTPGNDIGIANIPEPAAKIINDSLDQSIPGDWKTTGRVYFRPASPHNTRTALILFLISRR